VKEGDVTPPVKGRFGVVLVRVVKVEPERAQPFEEVAPELRKELAAERAKAEIFPLYDKIEDERSIGQNLTELAKKFNLTVRTVEVDRNGRDPNGVQVPNLPDAQRLLASAFAADAGVENEPLQTEGGYIWYEVASTTPARDRDLDEVRKQVEERWRQDEIASRLRAKATQMIETLKAGKPFAEVAAAEKLTVQNKSEIKRGAASAPLSEQTIEAIFLTAKNAYGSAAGETAAEQVVFRVTEITLPEPATESEEHKRLVEALNRSFADDVFGQYLRHIEQQVGVTINQTALRQVVTGQSASEN
jgi:peptidyl-prolyl cis-trans isomerase D